MAHLKDLARRHDHALVLVGKGVPVMGISDARTETARIAGEADRVSGAVVDAFRADSVFDPAHLTTALDHETRAVCRWSRPGPLAHPLTRPRADRAADRSSPAGRDATRTRPPPAGARLAAGDEWGGAGCRSKSGVWWRRAEGRPVSVETVLVPDAGPGEAVVAVQACGVCHTDLHYREGGISSDFPFLLGHEAAGVVEQVGPGVTGVAPGDFVVLNWRAVCGECRACRRGRPQYCFATHNATQPMTLADGTPLSPALGIGAFADKTLVAAGQCTPVDSRARPEAAGLLGCGVMAGLGAALFTGEVGPGDSVAVFGCGGVGCAAVMGARLAGASTIVAVDLDDAKLELARGFGATATVNAGDRGPGRGHPCAHRRERGRRLHRGGRPPGR